MEVGGHFEGLLSSLDKLDLVVLGAQQLDEAIASFLPLAISESVESSLLDVDQSVILVTLLHSLACEFVV